MKLKGSVMKWKWMEIGKRPYHEYERKMNQGIKIKYLKLGKSVTHQKKFIDVQYYLRLWKC